MLDEHFDASYATMSDLPGWRRYAVLEGAMVVGMTSYINPDCARRSVEIGATYIEPRLRETGFNARVKRLMIGHAFAQGIETIEFKSDKHNARSLRAIKKTRRRPGTDPRPELDDLDGLCARYSRPASHAGALGGRELKRTSVAPGAGLLAFVSHTVVKDTIHAAHFEHLAHHRTRQPSLSDENPALAAMLPNLAVQAHLQIPWLKNSAGFYGITLGEHPCRNTK